MSKGISVLAALAVFASLPALAQSQVPRRVTQEIDETRLTTLVGHIHPAANAINDRGPVDDSEHAGHIMLLLSRTKEQQQDLDALVDQLHNVHSENYHKWLTPAEFGRRFGPADADVTAVAEWLKSEGFTVEEIPPSKTHITFTGTVGQLQQAFHVEIHHLSVKGEAHESTMNEPQVPSALAPVIGGLHKLNDFEPKPTYKRTGTFKTDPKTGKVRPVEGTVAAASVTQFTDDYGNYQVGPQDFYTIYNENPLLTAGVTGAGVTIAVIEETEVNPADVGSFRSQFGLAAYPGTPNATQGGVNYIYGAPGGVGGDAACTAPLTVAQGDASGDEGEADIDLQWAGTVAPNATIDFVACGPELSVSPANFGSSGVDYAAQHIVNYLSGTVTAASLSYGWCESALGTSSTTGTGYYNNQWEQFAAEGITASVSAGDSGTTACDNGDYYVTVDPSVNGMGSSAYNVSAGGTDLGDFYISDDYTTSPASTWWGANTASYGSAKSYIPEITWGGLCSNSLFSSYVDANGDGGLFGTTPEALCNNSTLQGDGYLSAGGGSGGVSTVTAAPTWQSVYGAGLYSGSTTQRTLPDIALFAASGFWGHFMPFCESDVAACTADPNTDQGAGGTSFVAPQIAGLMALINQKTGARQGQADYTLYNLATQEYGTPGSPNTSNLSTCSGSAQGANVGATCIFRDIAADTPSLQGGTIASEIVQPCVYGAITDCYIATSGDTYGLSSIPGAASSTLAYYAGAGYDMTTGLGSVNIANLVNNWKTVSPGFASTTALSASAGTISSSGSVTLTATVMATGRGGAVAPAGVVGFYEGSTSGTLLGTGSISPSCTGSGASTACDGVATLIVAGTALNPGSNSIVAYFEGDGANDSPSTSAAVSVTVNSAPPALTSPAPGSTFTGSSVTFTWTPGTGVTDYQLWLGTTGVGSQNLYNSGKTKATSVTVSGLPTYGVTVYARLWSEISGVWLFADYTYTESGTPVPPVLTTPAPGSVLSGSSVTFTWTAGGGPASYQLWLGTTGVGSQNLYDSGATTATTETVSGLPANGAPVYARLWWEIDAAWQSADYIYFEAGTPVPPALITPVPGRILSGSTVAFAWTPSAGVTDYQLWLGSTRVGAQNLYDSGATKATTVTVSGLPTNGVTVYARLWWEVSGVWTSADYTYTEAGTPVLPVLTTPAPGSVLSGSSVAFTWTAGTGPVAYQLYLGTTGVGSHNLYESGSTTATTVTVNNVPTYGLTVYARLWWEIDAAWKSADYTYTEAGAPVSPVLTTPAPGSVLPGSSVAFTWTAGGGPSAYQLYLGTTGVGSHNLYESGATAATTVTVSTLPTAGVTVYARLWWLIGATWSSADYTYTEAGTPVLPVLTTPAPGSTLAGSSVAFTWTAGAGPAAYQLYVGTTGVGSHNLYESGATTATTVTVSDLPTNGVTVYVRLWWEIDAVWKSADYTYTAQ
jgi:subtilase family serine protease